MKVEFIVSGKKVLIDGVDSVTSRCIWLGKTSSYMDKANEDGMLTYNAIGHDSAPDYELKSIAVNQAYRKGIDLIVTVFN